MDSEIWIWHHIHPATCSFWSVMIFLSPGNWGCICTACKAQAASRLLLPRQRFQAFHRWVDKTPEKSFDLMQNICQAQIINILWLLFTGGDSASIADLLCAATLDQTKEAGCLQQRIHNQQYQEITNIQVQTMQQTLSIWRGCGRRFLQKSMTRFFFPLSISTYFEGHVRVS